MAATAEHAAVFRRVIRGACARAPGGGTDAGAGSGSGLGSGAGAGVGAGAGRSALVPLQPRSGGS